METKLHIYADDGGEIYFYGEDEETPGMLLKYRGSMSIPLPSIVFEPNGFRRIARETIEKRLIEEGKATEYEGKVYWIGGEEL